MTDLATIEASWDRAAVSNSTFNILTDPQYANSGWPLEEFFAHGRAEIDQAMEHLDGLGVKYKPGRALDFGCGVGRLTEALADHFKWVDGVDVSKEMIERARGHNTQPKRIRYHVNGARLPFRTRTFEFVYSMIVLQHMPQDMQHGYIREFFRVLKPGGVAMLHTPEGPDSGHPGWHLSMFGVPRGTVEEWIAESGTLIDVEELGSDSGWQNLRYTATA